MGRLQARILQGTESRSDKSNWQAGCICGDGRSWLHTVGKGLLALLEGQSEHFCDAAGRRAKPLNITRTGNKNSLERNCDHSHLHSDSNLFLRSGMCVGCDRLTVPLRNGGAGGMGKLNQLSSNVFMYFITARALFFFDNQCSNEWCKWLLKLLNVRAGFDQGRRR